MLLYSIRNWSTQFENNRTRELKKLDWIPMPNKQDGDGYTAIMDLPDGPAIYGTFLAIAQVASRCEPRGTLVRDGGKPHDSASLSRMTRIPVAIIEKALSALSDPDINWLECSGLEEIPHNPAPSCGISTAPGCASRARIPEGKGREGKEGKGENGMEMFLSFSPEMEKLKQTIGRWMRRRDTTAWSAKELKALKTVAGYSTSPEDLAQLERWYTASIPNDGDFRRRDVETLLNNWTGEIDRAKRWKPVFRGGNI